MMNCVNAPELEARLIYLDSRPKSHKPSVKASISFGYMNWLQLRGMVKPNRMDRNIYRDAEHNFVGLGICPVYRPERMLELCR